MMRSVMTRERVFASAAAVAGVLFLGFGASTLVLLGRTYAANADYSHGFLVPVIAAVAAWRSRDHWTHGRGSSVFGVLVAFLGMGIVLLGRWYDIALRPRYLGYVFLQGSGILVCFAGGCWALLGTTRFRRVLFPVAYLAFGLPLPESLVMRLTLPLQAVASSLATGLLRLLGIPVLQHGNVLHLPNGVLGVTEACSGIRSIWVLVAIAVAMAHFVRIGRWRAVLLVVSVPAFAIAANSLRVVVTGVLVEWGYEAWAKETAHEVLGTMTAALAGLGMFLVASLLRPRGRRTETDPPSAAGAGVPPARLMPAVLLCAGLALGIVGGEIVRHHYSVPHRGEDLHVVQRESLLEFPKTIGAFRQTRTAPLSDGELRALRPSDHLVAVYEDPAGRSVALSLLFWYPRRIRVSGRGYRYPHYAEICYEYQGWTKLPGRQESLTLPWLPGIPARTSLLQRGTQRHLILFWRSRETRSITYDFFGRGLLCRFHALIRSWTDPESIVLRGQYSVTIAVDARRDAAEADRVARRFGKALAPVLPAFGFRDDPAMSPGPAE